MKNYMRVEIRVLHIEEDVFCGRSGEGWKEDGFGDNYNDPNFA